MRWRSRAAEQTVKEGWAKRLQQVKALGKKPDAKKPTKR